MAANELEIDRHSIVDCIEISGGCHVSFNCMSFDSLCPRMWCLCARVFLILHNIVPVANLKTLIEFGVVARWHRLLHASMNHAVSRMRRGMGKIGIERCRLLSHSGEIQRCLIGDENALRFDASEMKRNHSAAISKISQTIINKLITGSGGTDSQSNWIVNIKTRMDSFLIHAAVPVACRNAGNKWSKPKVYYHCFIRLRRRYPQRRHLNVYIS